ncbi:MAG: hypothetical protein SLRJCFUN_001176 [Candidatus Fervidibacter sp.]
MRGEIPQVVGRRQSDALAQLKAAGVEKIRVIPTRPPKSRYRGEPAHWRVIRQRQQGDEVELVVTPEWLPFRDGAEGSAAGS